MRPLLDFIASMWDQFLVFWHALTPPVATVLAATIGAYAVVYQMGWQARNAIKLNRHNEALKLKLEVYKDIVGISRKASESISDVSAFIRKFQSNLSLARQMQDEFNGYASPAAHPSQLTDKQSQLYTSSIRVIAITETWQIIDTLIDALMTLQSYIFDFLSEMQTILVGEMFGHTIPPRVPADSTSVVIQLSRYDELSTYFKQQTNWGRNQAQIENDLRAGRTGS
jgi:hypothetical protein